jgi:hypothetical protein
VELIIKLLVYFIIYLLLVSRFLYALVKGQGNLLDCSLTKILKGLTKYFNQKYLVFVQSTSRLKVSCNCYLFTQKCHGIIL